VGAQGAKPPEAGEFSAFLTLNFECPEKEIYMGKNLSFNV
jgi:hypothetical protein